jgi:hypothetical protein
MNCEAADFGVLGPDKGKGGKYLFVGLPDVEKVK